MMRYAGTLESLGVYGAAYEHGQVRLSPLVWPLTPDETIVYPPMLRCRTQRPRHRPEVSWCTCGAHQIRWLDA